MAWTATRLASTAGRLTTSSYLGEVVEAKAHRLGSRMSGELTP